MAIGRYRGLRRFPTLPSIDEGPGYLTDEEIAELPEDAQREIRKLRLMEAHTEMGVPCPHAKDPRCEP